ncbi:hypothetical protein IWZ03DRAFT_363117 [Phyllosticta citriasiana]|uniref:Uncharacterized protein n=1 Tax=Phyllosticta citriasiana TaxID=595635 RepID=A0ABR1KA46_9PEZI
MRLSVKIAQWWRAISRTQVTEDQSVSRDGTHTASPRFLPWSTSTEVSLTEVVAEGGVRLRSSGPLPELSRANVSNVPAIGTTGVERAALFVENASLWEPKPMPDNSGPSASKTSPEGWESTTNTGRRGYSQAHDHGDAATAVEHDIYRLRKAVRKKRTGEDPAALRKLSCINRMDVSDQTSCTYMPDEDWSLSTACSESSRHSTRASKPPPGPKGLKMPRDAPTDWKPYISNGISRDPKNRPPRGRWFYPEQSSLRNEVVVETTHGGGGEE